MLPNGTSLDFSYDAAGNLISESDGNGNITRYEYDEDGQLIKTIYPDETTEIREYNDLGQNIRVTDEMGYSVEYEYDGGNLSLIRDALGNMEQFEYDSQGRMSAMVDWNGGRTEYEYDAAGNLTLRRRADGIEISYTYDALGNITSETDGEGNVTSYQYDCFGNCIEMIYPDKSRVKMQYTPAGQLKAQEDALGNVTSYQYDGSGNRIAQTDPLGRVTKYEYDENGIMTRMILPTGAYETYEYDDATGLLTSSVDAKGIESTFTYDGKGNILTQYNQEGLVLSNVYDSRNRLIEQTDANGRTIAYEYDAVGNLIRTVDPMGNETRHEYDGNGNEIKEIDALGNETSYEYDRAGQLVKKVDALGAVTSYSYDAVGNLTEETDAYGNKTLWEYDALNRLIRQEDRDGSYQTWEYDATGNITAWNNNGIITFAEYDLLGRKVRETTGGVSTYYSYDACSQLVSETDGEGKTTEYEYDSAGEMCAVTLPGQARIQVSRDKNGRPEILTDALGNETHYQYDEADRLVAVTDALGNVTSYEYDEYDNVSKVTDALGHITEYTYSMSGQLLCEKDPEGNAERYEYTPEGWLAKRTDGEGQETEYTYDAAGNVIRIQYPDGSRTENVWDAFGRLLSTDGIDGKTSFGYDENGRLLEVVSPDGKKVSYTYHPNGQKESMTYPDGKTVLYQYDGYGRLTGMTEPDGTVVNYEYDEKGHRTMTTDGGNTTYYTYDVNGNVLSILVEGSTDLKLDYEYDLNGRLISEKREENGKTVISGYVYDALNRLVSWKTDDGKEEIYTYDAVGNMIEKSIDGEKLSMDYDAANRIISMTGTDGEITYHYDKNGRLTEKTLTQGTLAPWKDRYCYNAAGRLETYSGYDDASVSYYYSAVGNLIRKESNGAQNRLTLEEVLAAGEEIETLPAEGQITEYVYDLLAENAQVITETVDGKVTDYLYGSERTAALITDGTDTERLSYVYDAHGSVVQTVSSKNEAVEANFRYTPYGQLLPKERKESSSGYLYNGENYDAMTGSYYLRARYYEPSLMRFGTPDVERGREEEPQSLNRYTYVKNNPVCYADPSGKVADPMLYMLGLGLSFVSAFAPEIKQAAAKGAVMLTTAVQKTTNQCIQAVKANQGFQAIVTALNKTPGGRALVDLGGRLVSVVTETQARAVANAQKAYEQVKNSNQASIRSIHDLLSRACSLYSGRKSRNEGNASPSADAHDLKDYYLYGQYGFDEETIRILKKLRVGIDGLKNVDNDWFYAQTIGRMRYGTDRDYYKSYWTYKEEDIKWDATVGGLPGSLGMMTPKTRMLAFGLSEAEVEYLTYVVRKQHEITSGTAKAKLPSGYAAVLSKLYGREVSKAEAKTIWEKQYKSMMGKSDFAHYNITIAAITSHNTYDPIKLYAEHKVGGDENLKDMSGWLGDATIIGKGEKGPSFTKDDYIADLDAENVTSIMKKEGIRYEVAVQKYHQMLNYGATRASIFLENNSYKEVEKNVLERVEKKNLKELKKDKNYKDTYSFLMSLKDNRNEMGEY